MEDVYRILQVSDQEFRVELWRDYTVPGEWPWSPRIQRTKWVSPMPIPFPFKSEEHAQKWIDDERKYPVVVKHPA